MVIPMKFFVRESLYSKFSGFFSKVAVNFIYIVLLSTNKHKFKVNIFLNNSEFAMFQELYIPITIPRRHSSLL